MVHSSLQILSKSLRFLGCRLATRSFSSLHRFSIGFKSGDWLGHSRTLICFFLSHSFVPWPYVFGHCHVGRPIHDPFSVLSLREGGCRPKFPSTWPHSSSPRYGEFVRIIQVFFGKLQMGLYIHVPSSAEEPCACSRILILHGVVCY